MPAEAALTARTGGRPAVVTGQQAGLFGGPLYTLYKLLGAIVLAGDDACPVFWLEVDDADIREVDLARVVDAGGELRSFRLEAAADGRPVGVRPLGDAVQPALDQLAAALPGTEHAAAAIADLRAAYRPDVRWHEALAAYLQRLVAPAAVVFLDPTEPAVKRSASGFFDRVIADAERIEAALAAGAAAVDQPQVPHRPGELPLFLLDEAGRRRKLVRHPAGFQLKGTEAVLTVDELRSAIACEPTRASPGVLLRPVLQDYLLPTRTFVGGPAELRYHAQLGPLYELLGVARPRLVPRPSFTLLEPRARRGAEKLGVPLEAALAGLEEIRGIALAQRADVDLTQLGAETSERVQSALDDVREALAEIDPGLDQATDEARRKIGYQIERLMKRATDALARRENTALAAAERLTTLLRPDGAPQERVLCPASVLTRLPAADLIDLLCRQIDPARPGEHRLVDLP